MIDRFTEQAKEAIGLAVDAAQELNHSYVGTEHLLIGLLQEGSGVAAKVLSGCGVNADKVIELVSQLISPNQNVGLVEQNTYTPSARRVLENSYREAVRFKAPLIGTEHLLIAMIRESDCVAARLLNTIGVFPGTWSRWWWWRRRSPPPPAGCVPDPRPGSQGRSRRWCPPRSRILCTPRRARCG